MGSVRGGASPLRRHGLLTVDTLLKKGITLDETAHLPAGLSYLEKDTFRMFTLNGQLGRLHPALLARHVPHRTKGLHEGAAWRSGTSVSSSRTSISRSPEWKRDVRLAYAGMVAPEIEGISPYRLAPRDLRYVPPARHLPWERKEDPSSRGPQPGKFAVSVNFERGMFLGSPCPRDLAPAARRLTPGAFYPDTSLLSSPAGAYAYFQQLTPRIEPEIGYSILLYDVSREEAQSARKRLGIPPLP